MSINKYDEWYQFIQDIKPEAEKFLQPIDFVKLQNLQEFLDDESDKDQENEELSANVEYMGELLRDINNLTSEF